MDPNLGDRFCERGKALEVADKKSSVLIPAALPSGNLT